MTTLLPSVQCYLVEWYRPEFGEETLDDIAGRLEDCAASMSAQGAPIRLLSVLAVPDDEVIFGVFAADAAQLAARACEQAGIPARRIARAQRRETPDESPHPGS